MLSLKAAEKSMVLLKNDNFLPLSQSEIKSVAVIGPTARNIGALEGNYAGTANHYETFVSGIQQALSNQASVTYALGCHLYADHAESSLSRANERESEAIIAAEHADIAVLCVGLDPTIEGEQGDAGNVYGSGDKPSLSLPGQQKRLIEKVLETGKPVILVLTSGSALSLEGLEKHPGVKAIIQAWYPGARGGQSIGEILFGKVNPSGKLPVTFYKDTNDLPDFEDYSMKGRTYRYFESEPLYPFGYGLTYGNMDITSVENSGDDPKNNGLSIKVSLRNSGDIATSEVIQVYMKADDPNEVKNTRLVAFARVSLDAGETGSVEIPVSAGSFKVVNETGERIIPEGSVKIFVGFGQPDELTERLTGKKAFSFITFKNFKRKMLPIFIILRNQIKVSSFKT